MRVSRAVCGFVTSCFENLSCHCDLTSLDPFVGFKSNVNQIDFKIDSAHSGRSCLELSYGDW